MYLPKELCAIVDGLLKLHREPGIGIFVYGVIDTGTSQEGLNQKISAIKSGFDAFTAEIPRAREALIDEFRKVLGVTSEKARLLSSRLQV